jgi:hypothetical protein
MAYCLIKQHETCIRLQLVMEASNADTIIILLEIYVISISMTEVGNGILAFSIILNRLNIYKLLLFIDLCSLLRLTINEFYNL